MSKKWTAIVVFCLFSNMIAVADATAMNFAEIRARVCRSLLSPENKKTTQLEQEWEEQDSAAWNGLSVKLKNEILEMRELSADKRKEYIMLAAEQIQSDLIKKTGTQRIGFHFNLHGGQRAPYVLNRGIHASRGDVGTSQGFSKDYSQKVYFFNLQNTSLYKIISAKNPNVIPFKLRMGDVMIIFKLDDLNILKMKAEGIASDETNNSLNFNEENLVHTNDFLGIPSAAFLLRPLLPFHKQSTHIGVRGLSWDESTLVALRFIELNVSQSLTNGRDSSTAF